MSARKQTNWRIGVAGLGSVGSGLLQILQEQPDFAPAGAHAVVTGVSARSRSRPRPISIEPFQWFDDPVALARSDEIDLFVELIGGSDGPAKAAVEAALSAGKPVVTANKALLAEHGLELGKLAEGKGAPLLFEAAVMGGTPAVKLLREGLVAEDVRSIAGILNGTCNFILTEMEAREWPFADVLAEAQRLGYAEADPTMDVGGFDAAHKITLLAALAFGSAPDFAAARVTGIADVELTDIRLARDLGYRIKLIASARSDGSAVSVDVQPMLVPMSHPLAQAGGALNALAIEGRRIGRMYLQGPGAGGLATAAAVAADIADVMTGKRRPVFGRPAAQLQPPTRGEAVETPGKSYLRLSVRDQRGVIAAVSETLSEADLSIDSFLQRPVSDAGHVPIVLTTHPAPQAKVARAVEQIAALDFVVSAPRVFPIATP